MSRLRNYLLGKELGRGATARVYLAHCEKTGAPVSVKVFHPQLFQDAHFAKRIQREIQVSAGLKHENIVPVLEVLTESEPPSLVMEFIDGENLEQFQAKLPYVLPEISVLIVIQILKALEYAHAKDLIHRDLKPENVLVRKDGRVFVTDFGLAKTQEHTLITQTDGILGSIDYMSPEQAGGAPVGPTSDLFSVAAMLYFLITGTRPFTQASATATLSAIRSTAPELPSQRNPKVSLPLNRILLKGLSKPIDQRYSNAREFREALEGYLRTVGIVPELETMSQWMKDPSRGTMELLRASAEYLHGECNKALKAKDRGKLLENISLLSIKAPQSQGLVDLNAAFTTNNRKKMGVWAAAVGGVVLLMVLVSVLVWNLAKRSHIANQVAVQPLPVVTPAQPQPVQSTSGQLSVPPAPAPMTTASTTTKPVSSPAPIKMGKVKFDVAADIEVFWDGKKVNAKSELATPVGNHLLELRRKGHDPIQSPVKVTATKVVEVRVQ